MLPFPKIVNPLLCDLHVAQSCCHCRAFQICHLCDYIQSECFLKCICWSICYLDSRQQGRSLYVFVQYLMKLLGLVVGVVCLEDGVSVPSSCSLRVSMVEWLSGVAAPLPCGVDWVLTGSKRELWNNTAKNKPPSLWDQIYINLS